MLRVGGALLVLCLAACGNDGGNGSKMLRPDVISLPTGFQPEGVAISGNSLFVGSIPTGMVFRADLTTGRGDILVAEKPGRSAIGMKASA
jgi:hypothetical protein